jgi:hypothetical protein
MRFKKYLTEAKEFLHVLMDRKGEWFVMHSGNENPRFGGQQLKGKMSEKEADVFAKKYAKRWNAKIIKGGKSPQAKMFEEVNFKRAAKNLLSKTKGTEQDDLHYRAYLRAVIDGKPTEHLVKKFKGSKKARQDLIDKAGIKEGYTIRSLTSEVPRDYISPTKANASIRSRINKDLHKLLKPTYFKLIPLDKIFNVLDKHGIVVLQEDQTEWSGFLTGGIKSTVQVHFLLGWKDSMDEDKRYQVIPNMALNLSYFKMPSGKFEVISYVS